MARDEDDNLYLSVKLLGACGGLVGGAVIGTILIILVMVFTGSTFGLTNIWPATVSGAVIGGVLGFFFPRIGKVLIELLARF